MTTPTPPTNGLKRTARLLAAVTVTLKAFQQLVQTLAATAVLIAALLATWMLVQENPEVALAQLVEIVKQL